MKTLLRTIIVIILSIIMSVFIKTVPGEFFISTIFNVAGIMFSVGLGLLVTFNLNGLKNKSIIQDIRNNLKVVRSSFIIHFSMITIVYLLTKLLSDNKFTDISFQKVNLLINWTIVFCILMIYSIIYFVINFFSIQKLNEQIYDELNK